MTQENPFAFRAARVFDGDVLVDGSPLVVVTGSRIAGIERTSAPCADLEVIDLGEVTLLPGLIDAHVHLAFDADSPTGHQELAHEDETTILARMRRHARQQLAAGVTTMRDLGDRDYLAV